MKKLDPNAKAIFYLSGVIGLSILFFFLFFTFFIVFVSTGELGAIGLLFFFFFVGMLVSFLLPWPIAHYTYENYQYELQKDNIYIERGIIWKQYVSIPYERIQNVDILRGPLARMFGVSDVQIQTAGSSTYRIVEGRIPGISVEDAKQLREEILAKVTKSK